MSRVHAMGEPVSATASGNGTLATVEFQFLDAGNCTLDLHGTILEGPPPEQLKIEHTAEDGYCYYSPTAPVAFFSYSPTTPLVYETVALDASDSYDPNGIIVSYDWDFGDGTNGTGMNVTHIYTTAGVHPVKLTVTDNNGETDAIIKFINIGKIFTHVSISTSCSSTFVGFRVNITGTLCDMYGNSLENETVILHYTFSGITEWVPINSDITDDLGEYFVIWIPPAIGYFVLKAEWAGNPTHSGSNKTVTLSCLLYDNQHIFSVESNSTISELAFNTTDWTLSFTAIGPNGTKGYTKITVAKSLVANITNIRVYRDGNQSEYSIASIDDSWLLTSDYLYSVHQLVVDLDITIVPEFPAWTSMLLILILFTVAIVFYKQRQLKTPIH